MIRENRLRVALACAVMLTAGWLAIGSAEPAVPNSPPGKTLHAWLTAFNSGDRAAMQRYLQTYAPPKRSMLDMFMDFRQQTGGFVLKKI
jgi:hypothetical protein